MKQLELEVFKFKEEDHFENIRTIEIDGEPWFVAGDITKALGYSNGPDAVTRHCKEKGIVKHDVLTGRGNQKVTLINEPNVYRLIVKSQKPSAEKFEAWLFEEVVPEIRKKGGYKIDRVEPSNFVIRYMANFDRIPKGNFSVISELYIRLYGRFEHAGYKIPNKAFDGKEIRPDTSVGRMFSEYLKKNYPSAPREFEKYFHKMPSGLEVEARLYPNHLVSVFWEFLENEWIPKHAEQYFYERDRKALDYLPKLIAYSNG